MFKQLRLPLAGTAHSKRGCAAEHPEDFEDAKIVHLVPNAISTVLSTPQSGGDRDHQREQVHHTGQDPRELVGLRRGPAMGCGYPGLG